MKQLQDYIRLYENAFPADLRDRLFALLKEAQAWSPAVIGSGFDPGTRDTLTMYLSSPEAKAQTPWLHDGIRTAVMAAFERYREEFPGVQVRGDTGYELLRYETGGFYAQHIDGDFKNPRVLSCSIALNDDYEGGEFGFFWGEMTVRMPALSIMLFPSNFQYPHEIFPVETGERFSIVTWLI